MVKQPRHSALFGGSFDPPHLGHRRIVEALLALPEIDEVVVVPAWLNPFKNRSHAPAQKRLQWCRRVCAAPGVVVSDYEIRQERPVRTWETLRALRRDHPIEYLVVGADNLATLRDWYRFDELNREITWIVVTRPGCAPDTSMLRRYRLLPLEIPVSSTEIRKGQKREFLDPAIREEVEALYPAPSSQRKEKP